MNAFHEATSPDQRLAARCHCAVAHYNVLCALYMRQQYNYQNYVFDLNKHSHCLADLFLSATFFHSLYILMSARWNRKIRFWFLPCIVDPFSIKICIFDRCFTACSGFWSWAFISSLLCYTCWSFIILENMLYFKWYNERHEQLIWNACLLSNTSIKDVRFGMQLWIWFKICRNRIWIFCYIIWDLRQRLNFDICPSLGFIQSEMDSIMGGYRNGDMVAVSLPFPCWITMHHAPPPGCATGLYAPVVNCVSVKHDKWRPYYQAVRWSVC